MSPVFVEYSVQLSVCLLSLAVEEREERLVVHCHLYSADSDPASSLTVVHSVVEGEAPDYYSSSSAPPSAYSPAPASAPQSTPV